MKKMLRLTATIALLFAAKFSVAQWNSTTTPGKLYADPITQKVGMGHTNPILTMDVYGTANIWAGARYGAANSKMAPGSLTIGNINANFGGGNGWVSNTAGLLMEALDNTEIAVHDNGTRLASLMYFEGGTSSPNSNRITIGRDMGHGGIAKINLNGNVGLGAPDPTHTLDVRGSVIITGVSKYLAFRSNISNTNGEWALEYEAGAGGLNFWKPFPSLNAGNYYMFIKDNGNVGIGTGNPAYKLDVCGTIRSKEVRVEVGWCDYVFEPDYKLRPLSEVESFIANNKHLPEIPSQAVIESEGLPMGEMQALHMKKIEELTLYIIELNKKIEKLEAQNNSPSKN